MKCISDIFSSFIRKNSWYRICANRPVAGIPKNGAKNVSLEYGLAWNYPWKEDYSGTSATVAISGPGLNETQTFQYPNNVMFVKLKPGGNYNWRVTVDGAVSDSWSFTAKDKVYPINDRSLDISIQDSTYLPQHIQKLLVSSNNRAFLRFDAPTKVDSSYKVELNLTPGKIYSLNDGIVLYKYCLLYTSPSPRDRQKSRMPSSA